VSRGATTACSRWCESRPRSWRNRSPIFEVDRGQMDRQVRRRLAVLNVHGHRTKTAQTSPMTLPSAR
jgi:hypothetical protein